MRNRHQLNNCDKPVRYLHHMVNLVLWKLIVIVVSLTRAVIFTGKDCVSTALSPPDSKSLDWISKPWCWVWRRWCGKSPKSNWINEGGGSSRLYCHVCVIAVANSSVPGQLWCYLHLENTTHPQDMMFREVAGAITMQGSSVKQLQDPVLRHPTSNQHFWSEVAFLLTLWETEGLFLWVGQKLVSQ